jgi:hypothetical protein
MADIEHAFIQIGSYTFQVQYNLIVLSDKKD